MQVMRVIVALVAVLLAGSARPASAELVFLTSGRSLSVRSHVELGEAIQLNLRTGGQVTFERSLISKIEPDEVPYPDPKPEAATSQADRVTAGLANVPFAELIDNLSAAHGVDPSLVKALIKVESGYKVKARSRKGAMGLMQLMPATARRYSVRNPYDPKSNLEAGIAHLASLLSRFDVSVALAAYNAGEAAVRRFGGVPPYRETRNYVRRIMALLPPR